MPGDKSVRRKEDKTRSCVVIKIYYVYAVKRLKNNVLLL